MKYIFKFPKCDPAFRDNIITRLDFNWWDAICTKTVQEDKVIITWEKCIPWFVIWEIFLVARDYPRRLVCPKEERAWLKVNEQLILDNCRRIMFGHVTLY